jgi:hypothetical protein
MEARDLDDKLKALQKKLDENFISEVKSSTPERLKEQIVALSKLAEDVDHAKENDSTLNTLKSQVSDLTGGYRDAKKVHTSRLQYILLILQDRGII